MKLINQIKDTIKLIGTDVRKLYYVKPNYYEFTLKNIKNFNGLGGAKFIRIGNLCYFYFFLNKHNAYEPYSITDTNVDPFKNVEFLEISPLPNSDSINQPIIGENSFPKEFIPDSAYVFLNFSDTYYLKLERTDDDKINFFTISSSSLKEKINTNNIYKYIPYHKL